MRIEYINPFVDASMEILNEVLGVEVKREDLYLKETSAPILGVGVLIGITGAVSGRVLIDMTKEMAIATAGRMNGEKIDAFNDLAKATIQELANLIVGRAVTKLHHQGFDFHISPPTILAGVNVELTTLQLEAVSVPVSTADGKIEVNIAVKELEE
jgi:chemotaxis protein CheX